MKKLVFISGLLTLTLSCEKKSTDLETAKTEDSVVIPETNEPVQSSTEQSCYVGNTGKDSVFVSLDDNLGTITGKMRYKNFEKDSSSGDVSGIKNGDTLKLHYSFTAEGTQSEREIYFLLRDGKLFQGLGEMKTEGLQELYTDPRKLSFDGQPLVMTDCAGFETKFSSK